MKRGKTEWEYPMPEEMNSPGAEYTPLPDEFLQGGWKKTNEPEKKRDRRMRRMYGMTAAFVLAGCVLFGVTDPGKDIPADDTEITENATGSKTNEGTEAGKTDNTAAAGNTDASDNTGTADNTGASDNTGAADSIPEYPLADGTVHILIYNDSFDEKHFLQSGLGEYNLLLAEETFAESYFTEGGSYTLPSYDKTQEENGYEFLGWAAYYKKKKADGGPKLVLLPDTLTEEDLLCFAPADGVRKVEIHAAWRTAESGDGTQTGSNMTNTLILQAQGGLIEGEESITYNAVTPLASAGAVYLCAYPVPVREGYTFTGWFETPEAGEENGTGAEAFQSVERLYATAFYEKDEGAAEPDWSAPKSIVLYAGWKKK